MKTPLYKCRTKEKLTQSELARKVNSSGPTISRLERGETSEISGRVCLNIIKHYEKQGLTLEHLINPQVHADFYKHIQGE